MRGTKDGFILKKTVLFCASCACTWAFGAGVVAPPPKDVPPLLVCADGTTVKTREQWETKRRPEILETLVREEYGRRPVERPADLAFAERAPAEECFDGQAIVKRVRATYSGPGGKEKIDFKVWIPKASRPVAAFIHSSPCLAETAANPEKVDRLVYLLPAREICARGYAVAAYCNKDVAVDWGFWQRNGKATNGVFRAYGPADAKNRPPDSWGILSAWGWGMSRVLDWMETEPLIDAKRVGSVGLSRNGKASLCAGVFDPRFAMVVSCCSGQGGAKLNHMDCDGSETIKDISIAQTWFAPNFWKYIGHDRDAKLTFDQHQFLALVAPRLLYVSSANEDAWAGPRGEFAALSLASAAWGLYGIPGLEGAKFPMIDTPVSRGNVGYHVRYGLHDITLYDWERYMDFADEHGWNR